MITKTSKIIRYAMITIVLGFFAFFLVSCGKKETITYKDLETEIQNAQLEKTRNALRTYLLVPEENADAQTSVYAKITSILTNEAITNTDEFLDNALNQLEAIDGNYALCSMCIGVGQGIAIIIKRVVS